MVLEDITLFKVDLQGAQIGPKKMDVPDLLSSVTSDESESKKSKSSKKSSSKSSKSSSKQSEDSSGGMSLGRLVVMAAIAITVATLIARRMGGSDEEEESAEIEFEAEVDTEDESPELS